MSLIGPLMRDLGRNLLHLLVAPKGAQLAAHQ